MGEQPIYKAVIDLGTNTFHLLLARIQSNGHWEEEYRKRIYVRLGEGGVDHIGEAANIRALEAMEYFKGKLVEFEPVEIKAIGTAALRKAENAKDIIRDIEATIGIVVQVIPGDIEARLISKGVTAALPEMNKNYLIMDIGGGSVEFIYRSQSHKTLFSRSYDIGVVVLHKKFHKNDPITLGEVKDIDRHLESTLENLVSLIGDGQKIDLVGASGTFDVLEVLLDAEKKSKALSIADRSGFGDIYKEIIHGTLADRLSHELIPNSRAELIVVAMQLIHFVLQKCNIDQIYISKYAMKEGILESMIDGSDPAW